MTYEEFLYRVIGVTKFDEKVFIVYRTTNLLSNEFYIGKHETCDVLDGYTGSGKRIVASVNKYGRENFKVEVMHVFDNKDESLEWETIEVDKYLWKDPLCLNLARGGGGASEDYTRNRTPERKAEISAILSASAKKRCERQTPEKKAALSATHAAACQNRSPEKKAEISANTSATQQSLTPERKAEISINISIATKKAIQSRTPERKAEIGATISEGQKSWDPEKKAEIIARTNLTKLNRSPEKQAEVSANISAAQKKGWEKRRLKKEKDKALSVSSESALCLDQP